MFIVYDDVLTIEPEDKSEAEFSLLRAPTAITLQMMSTNLNVEITDGKVSVRLLKNLTVEQTRKLAKKLLEVADQKEREDSFTLEIT